MSIRPIWILTLTLALPVLSGPAEAVPCSGNACRVDAKAQSRYDSRNLLSLQLSLQLRPIGLDAWSYGVSHHVTTVAGLPPGLTQRGSLTGRLALRDALPPGLRTRIDRQNSSAPPHRVVKTPGSSWDPGAGAGAPAVPEPTAAVLFASGLLVAATAARRARQSSATVTRA